MLELEMLEHEPAILNTVDRHDVAVPHKCGGAGGLLMLQEDSDVIMDNEFFRVAVARGLGGGLRPS